MKKDYKYFLSKAYPDSKRKFDEGLTILGRIYRPIGVKVGYIAWKLGLSGNAVTAIRIIMVLIGFFLLTISGRSALGFRLLGFFLIWISKILDYADGVVARANNSVSVFGQKFDELSDQPVSQGMMLSLIACYTGYVFLIPYSIFLEFVIHRLGEPLQTREKNIDKSTEKLKSSILKNVIYNYFVNKHHDSGKNNSLFIMVINFICKIFQSDFMHLALIPMFIAIFYEPNRYIWFPFGCSVLIVIYTLVAIVLFIGARKKFKNNSSF